MSMEQFTKPNFRAETLELIGQANEILSEYADQGFTLTLRQLYYQFVARQLIANEVFGFHSVADARNALRAFMEQAVYSEEGFLLGKQRYTFNRDGTGKETAFHVWQVETPSNKIGFTEFENY